MHQVGAHGDVDFFHGEGGLARLILAKRRERGNVLMIVITKVSLRKFRNGRIGCIFIRHAAAFRHGMYGHAAGAGEGDSRGLAIELQQLEARRGSRWRAHRRDDQKLPVAKSSGSRPTGR